MAGTFSQIYIQVVFAVQGRETLLQKPWREEVLGQVYQYILNQEKHHLQKTFKEEYLELLYKFEIEYDEKYLFDWNED